MATRKTVVRRKPTSIVKDNTTGRSPLMTREGRRTPIQIGLWPAEIDEMGRHFPGMSRGSTVVIIVRRWLEEHKGQAPGDVRRAAAAQ